VSRQKFAETETPNTNPAAAQKLHSEGGPGSIISAHRQLAGRQKASCRQRHN